MTTLLERGQLQTQWPSAPASEDAKTKQKRITSELPVMLLIAVVVALVGKTFFVQAFYIPSGSMIPTLLVKDRVIVNKLVYSFREPKRGEVIVFVAHPDETAKSFLDRIFSFLTDGIGVTTSSETDFIKRVIGLPGETVEVTRQDVFITTREGRRFALEESYIRLETSNLSLQEPLVVPDGHVFVMGDNRNNSSDSRSSLGPVRIDRIIGKAFIKVFPIPRIGAIGTPTYEDGSQAVGQAAGPDREVPQDLWPLAGLAVASTLFRRRAA